MDISTNNATLDMQIKNTLSQTIIKGLSFIAANEKIKEKREDAFRALQKRRENIADRIIARMMHR